jgi:hypothetical protein
MQTMQLLGRAARCSIAVLGCAALLTAADVEAQEAEIEPEAATLLQAMSDALGAATMFSASARTLFEDVQPGGMTYLRERTYLLFVSRPDGLHVRIHDDAGFQVYFWYDGAQLSRLIDAADERQYTQIDMLDSLDAILDLMTDTYHANLPLADLLYADAYGTFTEHLISGAYLGERTVRGKPAHHLSFESNGADFEFWRAAEGAPLPLRFAISYVTEPGEPLFVAEFDQWNLDPLPRSRHVQLHPARRRRRSPGRPARRVTTLPRAAGKAIRGSGARQEVARRGAPPRGPFGHLAVVQVSRMLCGGDGGAFRRRKGSSLSAQLRIVESLPQQDGCGDEMNEFEIATGDQHVLEARAVSSQSGRASARIRSRRGGWRPPSLMTSTSRPSSFA